VVEHLNYWQPTQVASKIGWFEVPQMQNHKIDIKGLYLMHAVFPFNQEPTLSGALSLLSRSDLQPCYKCDKRFPGAKRSSLSQKKELKQTSLNNLFLKYFRTK
jgi:hypothetical protein